MYRLIEIVKQGETESTAIYPFEDYTSAKGEFETRVGADMRSNAYSAFTLMVIDGIGKVLDVKHEGDGLAPRLLEVKVTDVEEPNMSKYDSTYLVEVNFHSKLGSAIKNSEVRAEMLRGIDEFGGEIVYEYWVRPIEEA